MDLGDIIDRLVERNHVTLTNIPQNKKESLRVQLILKFKWYKKLLEVMESLDPELDEKHLSFKYDSEAQTLRVELANNRPAPQYSILED